MKHLTLRAALLGGAALLIVGCAHQDAEFRDRNRDYHQAQPAHFPLPDAFSDRATMQVAEPEARIDRPRQVPRPASLRVHEAAELVERLQEDQGEWLLIQRSPGEVWPMLYAFAQQLDLPLEQAQPRQGLLQWAEDRASRLPAQRIQLRQGVRRGTSEVRLFSVVDQERLSYSDYDQVRLMALEQHVQASLQSEQQGVSLQAQELNTARVARLVDRDGRKVLLLNLEFERAWDELYRLLHSQFDDQNQQLVDFNRQQGQLYIRYVPEAERQSGFWAWLWRRAPAADAHFYQLDLTAYGEELDLVMNTEQGEPAPLEVEEELLFWIERQLR
ncbi:outer membrane protein assembly factor BamC [Marinospirillum sp. MEB164]|uniref:Outer membrane protein assembly factor BamC n=1 Tax=Marinospirillum alkalitolerans TaxID=3123374 RepID=A0ABW8PWA8_9GAMM